MKYKFNDLSCLVTDGDLNEFKRAIDDMFAINARLSNNDHLSLSFFMVANNQIDMLTAYYKKYRMTPEEAYTQMLDHLSSAGSGEQMAKFIAGLDSAIPFKTIEKAIVKLAIKNKFDFLIEFMNERNDPQTSETVFNKLSLADLSDEERGEPIFKMRHRGASEEEIAKRDHSCQEKKVLVLEPILRAYTGKPLDEKELNTFLSAFTRHELTFENASYLFDHEGVVDFFKGSDESLGEYMTPPNTERSRNEP